MPRSVGVTPDVSFRRLHCTRFFPEVSSPIILLERDGRPALTVATASCPSPATGLAAVRQREGAALEERRGACLGERRPPPCPSPPFA